MSGKVSNPEFLAEYQLEEEWAGEYDVHPRTVARYRADGMPFLRLGGLVWIHRAGSREYIASRVVRRNPRRNPPRRNKRQAASGEINTNP